MNIISRFTNLFNSLNTNDEIKLVKEYLRGDPLKLKEKYISDNITLTEKEIREINNAVVDYFSIKYVDESSTALFNWEFIKLDSDSADEPISLKKYKSHSHSVTFLTVINGISSKYYEEITQQVIKELKYITDRTEAENILNDSIKSVETFLTKSTSGHIKSYPIISETLLEIKEYLEGIDLTLRTFKSDFDKPIITPPIENITMETSSKENINTSSSKILWKKDSRLFYILFSALYEKGFISNSNGKINLKAVANLLYESVSLKQKIGNTVEDVEFKSFYQNLKSSSNLQEEPLSKDIKSLIIKCLEDVEKM